MIPAPSVDTSVRHSTVLLIEDDPDTRFMYEVAFGQEGLRATGECHAEGVSAARELCPAVIVADVGPPGSRRVFHRMLCELREHERTRHIPVIAVTGYEIERSAAHAHVQQVLLKPVDPAALITSVRAALRERAARLRAGSPQVLERSDRAFERSFRLADKYGKGRRLSRKR